jgi:hypothetical protein
MPARTLRSTPDHSASTAAAYSISPRAAALCVGLFLGDPDALVTHLGQ